MSWLALLVITATHWVSPMGGGDGSRSAPWSLEQAQAADLKRGDNVRLLPGQYDCSDACILDQPGVRWDGEGATIVDHRAQAGYSWRASTLTLWADGITLRGLTVVNTTTERTSSVALPTLITTHGAATDLVDLTLSGGGTGVFVGAAAKGTSIRHSIIAGIGWTEPGGRGRGHGVYIQGSTSLYGNTVHDVRGYCVQVWGSAPDVSNQSIAHNRLSYCGRGGIVVGAASPVRAIRITDNAIYTPPPHALKALSLQGEVDAIVRRNLFLGVTVTDGNLPARFERNTLYGRGGRGTDPFVRMPVVDYGVTPQDECAWFCDFKRRYPDNVYRNHAGECACHGGD